MSPAKKITRRPGKLAPAVKSAGTTQPPRRGLAASSRRHNRPVAHMPPSATACAHCELELKTERDLKQHLAKSQCGDALNGKGPRAFLDHVQVKPATPAQSKARAEAMVHIDRQSHVALELYRTKDTVTYLPYDISGVAVERTQVEIFDQAYRRVGDYPTGRCATLFVGFALQLGATSEAMSELEKLVHITDQERDMAAKKLAANKATRSVVTKVVRGKSGSHAIKGDRKVRNSASSMFKGLIMEGKLTDEEIFQKVKKEFKLDDSKRTYVAWYRNALKKDGKNPPPAKAAAK